MGKYFEKYGEALYTMVLVGVIFFLDGMAKEAFKIDENKIGWTIAIIEFLYIPIVMIRIRNFFMEEN